MPISEHQAFDGKSAEHFVLYQLLKRDHVPFIPVLDRGIDIVIKSKTQDLYYEIQVKSNNSPIKENQQWFIFAGQLKVRKNLIYILVDMIEENCWIIPSKKVKQYGNQCKTQFDLHLQQKKQGQLETRGELLADYKNNWDILI